MSQVYGYSNLRVGEEAMLPERFMGKQVYATLVDFGALPGADSEKAVAHGLTDLDQFGIDNGRSFVLQANGTRHALFYPNAVPNGFWRAKVDADNVSIHVGEDRSAFTSMVCVWYTKASEIPDTALDDTNIAPGPEGTHLVSRGGKLVWEAVVDRVCITENLHVYVAVDGNDGNDGLAAGPDHAFATVHRAVQYLHGVYFNGFNATITIAPGTYPGDTLIINRMPGDVAIEGETKENTILRFPIYVEYSKVAIRKVKMDCATNGSSSIVSSSATISLANMAVNDTLAYSTIRATRGGIILINGQIEIAGKATFFIYAEGTSYMQIFSDAVLKFTGTATYSTVAAQHSSIIYVSPGAKASGSVTGKRYYAALKGLIDVSGAGANFFPGSTAGAVTTATQGLYA